MIQMEWWQLALILILVMILQFIFFMIHMARMYIAVATTMEQQAKERDGQV